MFRKAFLLFRFLKPGLVLRREVEGSLRLFIPIDGLFMVLYGV